MARAFAACDLLRSQLRDSGLALTDAQTQAQYDTRVTHLAQAGDYMLAEEAMRRLEAAFGELTVDAFASGATALLKRFWSVKAVDGAEGVDAFAQPWAGEHLLVHAPVGCLGEVIEKLEREPDAAAVVVCPYWTGAPWYEPLAKLAADSLILPVGSLRAVATHTGHVKAWRAIAFHIETRTAGEGPPVGGVRDPGAGTGGSSFRKVVAGVATATPAGGGGPAPTSVPSHVIEALPPPRGGRRRSKEKNKR